MYRKEYIIVPSLFKIIILNCRYLRTNFHSLGECSSLSTKFEMTYVTFADLNLKKRLKHRFSNTMSQVHCFWPCPLFYLLLFLWKDKIRKWFFTLSIRPLGYVFFIDQWKSYRYNMVSSSNLIWNMYSKHEYIKNKLMCKFRVELLPVFHQVYFDYTRSLNSAIHLLKTGSRRV